MLRLTAVLLVSLYAAMSIWGEPPAGDVVVTRSEAFSPTLADVGSPAPAAAAAESDLSALTAREAVEAALAAGAKRADDAVRVAAVDTEPEAEEAEAPVVYVTGSRVNLRDGPTTNSAIVGSVTQGDRAEPLSDLGDSWVRIRTERGVEAWIYGRFLSETPA